MVVSVAVIAAVSAEMLCASADLFWKPAQAVVADPASFVLELSDGLGSAAGKPEWLDWAASLKAKEETKEEANERKAQEEAQGRGDQAGKRLLNPLHLCTELEKVWCSKTKFVRYTELAAHTHPRQSAAVRLSALSSQQVGVLHYLLPTGTA